MHEQPFSVFAVVGFVATLLGPILGPLALLIFASVMGALLAMGRVTTMTRWEGLRFVVVGVGISMVLTGLAVWLVEAYTPIPGNIALMPVAFAISLARSSLLGFIEKVLEAATNFVSAFASRKGGDQ